jgi:hypothetical protein
VTVWWRVAVGGLAAGAALFWAFRKFARIQTIRTERRKLWAHVLGLFLFAEDPVVSWRVLGSIVRCNLTLLVYVLPPLLAAAPFVGVTALCLNRFFSATPLAPGQAGVLTVRFSTLVDPRLPAKVDAPAWLRFDSPPVHVRNEISWRVRAKTPGYAEVRVTVGAQTATHDVDARDTAVHWIAWFAGIASAAAWTLWLAMPRIT